MAARSHSQPSVLSVVLPCFLAANAGSRLSDSAQALASRELQRR